MHRNHFHRLLSCFTVTVCLSSTALVDAQLVFQSVVGPVFDRPVFVTSPPGDSQRLFVLEQHTGLIRIIKNGAVLDEPFLSAPLGTFDEQQGLLGMAFHPNYTVNRQFFISLTDAEGDLQVLRCETLPHDPDKGLVTGLVIEIDIPGGLAIGGWLGFRHRIEPYLYVSVGDGMGGPNMDPTNAGQNINFDLRSNLLRLDVDNGVPYAIPPLNPYVNNAQALDEIWVFGLRNPWRCSFDRLTDDLWIGDTGYNNAEEINFQQAMSQGGENYGWACFDGPGATGRPCHPQYNQITQALYFYNHQGGRCGVIGGYVYRGCSFADFPINGCYIFGDYCSGDVYARNPANGQVIPLTPPVGFGLTSFGEDADGELYVCLQGPPGDVRRLVAATGLPPEQDCNHNGLLDSCDIASGRSLDENANEAPDECECPVIESHPTEQIVVAGQSADFGVIASGPGLSYEWRRNGGPISAGPNYSGINGPTLTINPVTPALAANYHCVVSNLCGTESSDPARLYVACPFTPTGDVNNDGSVNGSDIPAFTSAMLAGSTSPALICRCDFNANGRIDESDLPGFLAILLAP